MGPVDLYCYVFYNLLQYIARVEMRKTSDLWGTFQGLKGHLYFSHKEIEHLKPLLNPDWSRGPGVG